jgi:hypothetical protein
VPGTTCSAHPQETISTFKPIISKANAGGASIEAVAAKMANSIDRSSKLKSVYQPVDPATVREADRARIKGRNQLASDANRFEKLKLEAWKS